MSKKLFDGKSTVLSDPTSENIKILCELATKYDVRVYSDTTHLSSGLYYSDASQALCGHGTDSRHIAKATFEQFIKEIVLPKPTTVEVKLNDEYTAIVSKTDVKVGCQTFPIRVVEQILIANKSLIMS